MPSVNSVSSLLQLSVAHIVTRIENLDLQTHSTTNSVMGELGNLFHQLRKLEKIFYYIILVFICYSLYSFKSLGASNPQRQKRYRSSRSICSWISDKQTSQIRKISCLQRGILNCFPPVRKFDFFSLAIYTAADSNCLRELGIHCKNLRYVKSIYLHYTIINSFRFLIVLLWTGYWMFSIVGMSQTQEFNYCVSIHTIILFWNPPRCVTPSIICWCTLLVLQNEELYWP